MSNNEHDRDRPKVDSPGIPEFASWESYRWFADRVRHHARFVHDSRISAFLATVMATRRDRDVKLPLGMILYRAQEGIEMHERIGPDGGVLGEEPSGYTALRMKPRPRRATEGRANPSGIPVLYLATAEQTAISEIRPWIGAEVSVAQFRLARELNAIDLSRNSGKFSFALLGVEHLTGKQEPDAKIKEQAVWIDIDNAFSRPVTRSDDAADYAPTQLLAEFFRHEGYDALVYKSQFGDRGYNVAVFDIADADAINCAPYEVTSIDVKFSEIGNRWYRTEPTSKLID